jgi:hypothetical protein
MIMNPRANPGLRTSADQRPSPKEALIRWPGSRGCALVSPPVMIRSPGSSARSRPASCSASQATPAAGCPLAAAPVPRSTTSPSTDSTTGSAERSETGSGGPTTTQAADEPSAVLSSSVNR